MEYELVRLAHSGVKGMKWGVRRYQNKDGTLTAAGKKRYNKTLAKVREEEKKLKNQQATKAKIDRLNARVDALNQKKGMSGEKSKTKTTAEIQSEQSDNTRRRRIKKMSDSELTARIERLTLEENCKKLEKSTTSRGKSFILDVLETSGKNIATQATTHAMGLVANELANKLGFEGSFVNPTKGQKDK